MVMAFVIGVLLVAIATVVVSLWREIMVIQARVGSAGTQAIDGPEIGTLVPARLRGADAVYLFVSDHCSACHDVVERFHELDLAPHFPLWVVRVAEPETYGTGSEIIEGLPQSLVSIPDADAARVVRQLAIRATPLAIAVRDGLVTAKGYVRGPEDVLEIARSLRPLPALAKVGR